MSAQPNLLHRRHRHASRDRLLRQLGAPSQPQARTWRDYRYDLRQFAASSATARPATSPSTTSIASSPQQAGARLQAWHHQPPPGRDHSPSTPSSPTTTPTSSAPSCRTATPSRSASACRAPSRPTTWRKFFAAVDHDPRDRAMFLLMLRCGLRISEVAACCLCGPLPRRDPSPPGRPRQGQQGPLGLPLAAGRARPARLPGRASRHRPATTSSSATRARACPPPPSTSA